LTAWRGRAASVLRRGAWAVLAPLLIAAVAGEAFAARVTVVLSEDSAPYEELYQVMRVLLDDAGHEVEKRYPEAVASAAAADARLHVAVGVRAAEALSAQPGRAPVLAVLVPRSWYQQSGRARLADGGRRNVSAIYVDQPFERQAQLIRLAFPEGKRVGVLTGAEQKGLAGELEHALRAQRLTLVHHVLADDERLVAALERVLAQSDLLLALPDAQVFSRNTAQSLFLTTYRYRIPVLGYSRSLTRAGALLSLHSSPAQVGRQAAEWIRQALQGKTVELPPASHPAYFGVSVNAQVARSLGIALADEGELEQRMGGTR
jgi:ABC-type uncharacterized transport system substrate-binding protein